MYVNAHFLNQVGKYSVTLDGKSIDNKCYAADDRKGLAWCYSVNAKGEKFTDPETGDAAKSCLAGQVVITKLTSEDCNFKKEE